MFAALRRFRHAVTNRRGRAAVFSAVAIAAYEWQRHTLLSQQAIEEKLAKTIEEAHDNHVVVRNHNGWISVFTKKYAEEQTALAQPLRAGYMQGNYNIWINTGYISFEPDDERDPAKNSTFRNPACAMQYHPLFFWQLDGVCREISDNVF